MARVKPLAELIEGCIGPAFAAQGFASTVVEQPAVADAIAAAGPVLDQADAAWQALTTSQPV